MDTLSAISIDDELLRDSTRIITLAAQCLNQGNTVTSFSIGKSKKSDHDQTRKLVPAARLEWCIDTFLKVLSYSPPQVNEMFVSFKNINTRLDKKNEATFEDKLSDFCIIFKKTLMSLDCTDIPEEVEEMITNNDLQLTKLRTTATAKIARAISSCTTLQSLSLKTGTSSWNTDKGVGKTIADYIANSSELRFLTLRVDDSATAAICKGFETNTSLVGLSLTLRSAQTFLDAIHVNPACSLQYLQITNSSDSNPATDFLLKSLPKNLKHLDLSGLGIGDNGVSSFASLASNLENFSNLAHLNLSCNNIQAQGGYTIANMLANNLCNLSHLDLQGNTNMELSCHSILSALATNTTLRFLDISGCYSQNLDEGCVPVLIAALSKNRTLEELRCYLPPKKLGNLSSYFVSGTFSLKKLGFNFAAKHLERLPVEARKFFTEIESRDPHGGFFDRDKRKAAILKSWRLLEDEYFARNKSVQHEEPANKKLKGDKDDIWEYIHTNDGEKVKKAIEQDKSIVGALNGVKQTPLILAALLGHTEIVNFLVAGFSDINYRDEWGRAAIHYAKNSAIAEKLIAGGARVDEEDTPGGWTPLCYAVASNDSQRVKVLLKNGAGVADVEAISMALLLGYSEIAKDILEHIKILELPEDKFEVILMCCVIGKDDRLSAQIASQMLTKREFQWPQEPKYDYLFASVAAKKMELSKVFIEHKAPMLYSVMGKHNRKEKDWSKSDEDPHPTYHFHPPRNPRREGSYSYVLYYSPLRKACKNEDIAHIELLLNSGFDAKKDDKIFQLVGEFNTKLKRDVVKYVSKYHRQFGRHNYDAPKVKRSKEEIRHAFRCVRALVSKGVNLWSPRSWMHKAIAVNDLEMFEFVDNYGTMPTLREVQVAAKEGNEEMLARFVEVYKLPVSSQDGFSGLTPLLMACKNGHTGCINYLLDHGASLNETCDTKVDGWLEAEAGHIAVGFNRPELLKLILSRAGPGYKIQRGLEIAVKGRYEECVKILLESGHVPEPHHIEYAISNDKSDKKLQRGGGHRQQAPLKRPQKCLPWNPKILALMLKGQAGAKEQVKALFEKSVIEDAKEADTRGARTEALLSCFGSEVLSGIKKLLYITSSTGNAYMTELLLRHMDADIVHDLVEEEKEEKNKEEEDPYERYYGGYKKPKPPPLLHMSPLHCLNPKVYPINTTNYVGFEQAVSYADGYSKIAHMLLTHKRPANVNITDNKQCTPLFYACQYGTLDVVKVLLEAGADVNIAPTSGTSPLFVATCLGRLDVVKLLLLHHPDLELPPTESGSFKKKRGDRQETQVKYNPSETALHIACQSNDAEMVRTLVSAGANVAAVSSYKNFTPLHYAALATNAEILKILVDANKEILNLVNADNQNAFAALMTDKSYDGRYHFENSKFFVSHSQSQDLTVDHTLGLNVVHIFVMKQLSKLLSEILELNPSLVNVRDKHGHTPLHFAALFGDSRDECGKVLFEKGADVNAVCDANRTFAHFVAMRKDTSFLTTYSKDRSSTWNTIGMAKSFYDKKYNITKAVNTMTNSNDCSCASMLRKLGTELRVPEIQTKKRDYQAAKLPFPPLETFFKGNINEGMTPLACALFLPYQYNYEEDTNKERWAYARLLLDCGADPNVHLGLSPLNIACQLCPLSVVELLVDFGAILEPNLLHVVIESKNHSVQKYMIAKYLIWKGIALNKEVNSKTPIQLAEELSLVDIVHLLLQNGAEAPDGNKKEILADNFTMLRYVERSHMQSSNSHDNRNATMCINNGYIFLSQFRGFEVFSTLSPKLVANVNVDPNYGSHKTSFLFAWNKYMCHVVVKKPLIYLFSTETCAVAHTLEGHTDEPLSLCEVDTNLCSSSKDGTIKLWDTSLKCVLTLEAGEPILKLAYSAPYLFARTQKTFDVQVWNISSGKKIASIGNPTPAGHIPAISRNHIQGALAATPELVFFVDESEIQGYELANFQKKVSLPIVKNGPEQKYSQRERVKEFVLLVADRNKLFVLHNYTPDELRGQIYELKDLAQGKVAPLCTFSCPGFQEACDALIHEGKLYVVGAKYDFCVFGCSGAGVAQHQNCSFRCTQSPPPSLQQQCRNLIAKKQCDYDPEVLKTIPAAAKGILAWEVSSKLDG